MGPICFWRPPESGCGDRPEGVPGEVLTPFGGYGQIVFDPDATEFHEPLDGPPVDELAPRVGARCVQQLRDEVDPRLHGHDEPRLERAREAQVRIGRGPWQLPALR